MQPGGSCLLSAFLHFEFPSPGSGPPRLPYPALRFPPPPSALTGALLLLLGLICILPRLPWLWPFPPRPCFLTRASCPHPPLTQASPLLLSPSLTMPGSRASTASASAAVSAARPRQHQKSMSASVHPNKATGLPPTDSNCEVPRPRQVCWGSCCTCCPQLAPLHPPQLLPTRGSCSILVVLAPGLALSPAARK